MGYKNKHQGLFSFIDVDQDKIQFVRPTRGMICTPSCPNGEPVLHFAKPVPESPAQAHQTYTFNSNDTAGKKSSGEWKVGQCIHFREDMPDGICPNRVPSKDGVSQPFCNVCLENGAHFRRRLMDRLAHYEDHYSSGADGYPKF